MTPIEKHPHFPARNQWIQSLCALNPKELINEVDALTKGWEIIPKTIPQSGLAMLKLQDSAFYEPFFLGEIPLSSAWVEICSPEGKKAEGAAQVMDDNIELAKVLAICDSILANDLPGSEPIAELVKQGRDLLFLEEQRRKSMLAKTRVDFSLLDDVGESDES
jgi:alpha-D-ribose 1-methylphosphonate 5-triphosphate synthase subunit PhnG